MLVRIPHMRMPPNKLMVTGHTQEDQYLQGKTTFDADVLSIYVMKKLDF